ncbi:biotin synthase [Aquabacterium sp.]|uniref:biotin synthase n=1 Tax=Aquabacterium sp. TaxID=1872578 RepID=UPI002BCBEAA4|nr:biotin synthase [Aquabacterium sp.]HSW03389.1 biotin synthase [Aquabacterium sp.]
MAEPALVDPHAVAHVLDRLARADAAPWLHQEVARRMAQRLPVIRQPPQRWLDWWGFVGGGEAAVKGVLPAAQRRVVEPTRALLHRSQQALRRPWWALGRRGDPGSVMLEAEVPPASAQMVWANMVLHASPQPVQLLALWQAALAVDGFLMFSTLGPDSLRELREVYAACGWAAPHPPFTDMHDIGDQLVHGGFADPVMDQETLRLTWSSPQALLDELRTLGGHVGVARQTGLRTPRWRQRLLSALGERADAQGRIGLSFEIVYGHAFKAAPRPAAGAPVTVPLEQLRASLASRRGKPEAL